MSHPLRRITKSSKFLLVIGIIAALLSAGVSVLFPLQYRADAGVLIVSQSRYGVDPYTVVKSAERVGENIVQVMKTNDFFEKVKVQEGYTIDWNHFDTLSEQKKRKRWQKDVQGSVVFGTGVLNISAYSTEKAEARALAGAAADTLVSKGWQYVGGDVTMQVVNRPVVTEWPARPHVLFNAIIGFVVGVLLGAFAVVRR